MSEKREVWKYQLRAPSDWVEIEMQAGANILHVAAQYGVPCIWACVDPEAGTEVRRFRFAGTGHSLGENVGAHLGSFEMDGGALIWHLFQEMKPAQ